MAGYHHKSDVFPVQLISDSIPLLPRRPDFKEITHYTRIYPFIPYMDASQIVSYKPEPFDDRYKNHFKNTVKGLADTFDQNARYHWDTAEQRLKNPLKKGAKQNVDCRTSYKFHLHHFLVKAAFTTGQRTVLPGTVHVYQVHRAALKLYFVPRLHQQRVRRSDRRFQQQDQHLYAMRTLEAYHCYAVPEDTVYVVCAVQTSYFSVHVWDATKPLPFLCINPLTDVPPPQQHRQPLVRVPTPPIEDTARDEVAASDEPSYRFSSPPQSPGPEEPNILPSDIPVPEPTQQQHVFYHQILYTVPVEKTIEIVEPCTVQWYQSLQHRPMTDPRLHIPIGIGNYQEEPLDLSATRAPSPEMADSGAGTSGTEELPNKAGIPEPTSSENSEMETRDGTAKPDLLFKAMNMNNIVEDEMAFLDNV